MFREQYVRGIRLGGKIPSGSFLKNLPVIRSLQETGEMNFSSRITVFTGENGVGKSTLVEALAVAMGFNPEGGTINFRFSTEDSHSELHQHLTVLKGVRRAATGFFLRAESFYNVATSIDRMDEDPLGGGSLIHSYGGVSLHRQSHGESFLSLVMHRFGENGLYILDEPEAALSPAGQLRLICHISDLVKRGSQFILSTHSPFLIAIPDAEVYEISGDGIHPVPFRETGHFRIASRFMKDPEGMIRRMLEEGQ